MLRVIITVVSIATVLAAIGKDISICNGDPVSSGE
jgi:hypothetical protein